jgi:carbon-monoxide dehydrogenase large subunit
VTGPQRSGWIGASLPRFEDTAILRGEGRYFADLSCKDQLHLVLLRSPHPHARILSIETTAARALPGVVAVVTGDDLREQMLSLPQASVEIGLQVRMPEFWPLAVDKVKFNGEPVVAVVATDPYIAEDALDLLEVDYDPLPWIGDMEAALVPGADRVHDEWPDNELFTFPFRGRRTVEEHEAHRARTAERMDQAAFRVQARFRTHRCGVTALEPRGALATWDPNDGLVAWITTQRPHMERLAIADVLQLPPSKVRVITPPHQGGAFGMKSPIHREPLLVCHLARQLRRPVRWLETREENLLSVGQERDQIHDLELSADADGVITALRDKIVCDGGDGCSGMYWASVMPMVGGARLPNAYEIPFCDIQLRVASTNKPSLSPARGFGAFPARFALERAIDLLANRIGVEPAALRRKNLIRTLPAVLSTGVGYDSGDFVKTFDRLVELIDIPKFRAEQAAAWANGRYIGLGIGLGVEASGVDTLSYLRASGTPSYASASVRIDARGFITVVFGDAPHGQGAQTTIAQVVASELGVQPECVSVISGDTMTTPYSAGTVASRGAALVLPAIALACRKLKAKMTQVFMHDMGQGASAELLEFSEGTVRHVASGQERSFNELASRIVVRSLNLPPGVTGGLEETAVHESGQGTICFGAHAAFVEVEPATGKVSISRYVTSDDAGVVINPLIVHGQIEGGVVQGISNFFFEEYLYDADGQQLTTTLANYKIANAADVPRIEVHHDAGTPCTSNPLGTRGIGEGCISPVPGALGNAISDALRPLGISITELPVRPATLQNLIRNANNALSKETSP